MAGAKIFQLQAIESGLWLFHSLGWEQEPEQEPKKSERKCDDESHSQNHFNIPSNLELSSRRRTLITGESPS
jgi:hypothetical protein